MITSFVKQQALSTLSRFRLYHETIGESNDESDTITNTNLNSNKDIYGQDKTKLKSSETSRYFQCENCARKIAGGRFAQHINKCLERKRK